MTMLAARILLAIAFLPCMAAAAEAPPDTARIDELMRKSGMWTQIAQVQGQVKSGIEQARASDKARGVPPMTDAQFARLQAAALASFSPERLRASVGKVFAGELTASDIDAVLAWLTTDLGKRITALEEESGEVEALKKSEREAPAFLATLPEARAERLHRFAQLTRTGEAVVSTLINITTAVVYGVALATPPSDTSGVDLMRKRLDAERPQMVASFTRDAVAQFAYMYRTLTDDEVDRYIAFAETPSGRKYNDATLKAFDEALSRASFDMGREIGRGVPAQPPRSS